MKRITSMLTMVMIAMLSFTFVSCELDDDDIAYNLEGVWEGEIRGEYFDRYGHGTTYNGASGSGREIDFDAYGYYTDVVNFRYTVENGTIYLSYSDGTDVAITHFTLWSDEFHGEFRDYETGRYLATFRFYRVNSWRNDWRYDHYNRW